MPNHYVGDLLSAIGISGRSRVRTELFELAVVPALPPHPVQMHCQLSSHCHLRDLSSTAHRKVEKPTAPLRLTSYGDLRRFHPQKPEQCVPLLADVPQPPPIAAGFLRRYQPHIAGDLFPAVKAFGSSDHQLESQCPQRSNSGMRHQSSRHRPLLHFLFHSTR